MVGLAVEVRRSVEAWWVSSFWAKVGKYIGSSCRYRVSSSCVDTAKTIDIPGADGIAEHPRVCIKVAVLFHVRRNVADVEAFRRKDIVREYPPRPCPEPRRAADQSKHAGPPSEEALY